MIRMVRRLAAPLAVLLVVGLPAVAWAQSATLRILHINDVYEISPKRGQGGMAQLMTLLKQERARAEHHITTLGGDLISPSVMSGLTKGQQMIEMMNAIGVDLAGLGNHEFDFGNAILQERMAQSKFTWVATNTLDASGKPWGGAAATVMRDVGELKVGFFSLLTPETEYLSSPESGVVFKPEIETAKDAVKSLKDAGADVIIALTHLDIAKDREMARTVKGISVILGGHDHDPITFYEGGTLILKAGHDAHYLAVADVAFEKKETSRGVRVSMLPQWRFLATAGVAPDPEIDAKVKAFEGELDKQLSVAVGKTSVMLDSRRASVRSGESNFGNLIADAMKAGVGADVALTNGGGIRGDRTYDAGTTLTRKDILTELPFGNVTVMMKLKGADLLAALENGVSRVEDTAGRFPHVAGMTVKYDRKMEQGKRVTEVMVGGAMLDPNKVYTLATNDYIANGGDGYAALKNGEQVIDASGATLMATMVMNHITKMGTVAPKLEGRITE